MQYYNLKTARREPYLVPAAAVVRTETRSMLCESLFLGDEGEAGGDFLVPDDDDTLIF